MVGDPVEATAIIEATARSMERAGPSPERARVLASMAATYMLQGDHARAVPAAEAAIALAREVDAPVSVAHAMSTLGTSKALLGLCDEGCRCRARRWTATWPAATSTTSVGRMPTSARCCSSAGSSRRASPSPKRG